MKEGELKQIEGEPGKTETFSNFGLSNMEAMRLLRDFGLLGKKESVGKLEGKEKTYRNIAEHSLVVGMTADVILEKLEERGFLTPEERKMGTKAAIIHDLTKMQEIELKHGVERYSSKKFLNPDEKEDFVNNLLKERNVSQKDREILSLSDLTGEGVLNFPDDKKLDISYSPKNLVRFAIFFSDYVVAHTALVKPEERMREVIERSEYNDLDIWWYKKIYGEEELRGIEDPKKISEKVRSKTMNFLKQTEEQFKVLLGVDASKSLSDFIEGEIKKRYESNAH